MKKYGKLLPLFLAAPLLMSCGNKKVESPKFAEKGNKVEAAAFFENLQKAFDDSEYGKDEKEKAKSFEQKSKSKKSEKNNLTRSDKVIESYEKLTTKEGVTKYDASALLLVGTSKQGIASVDKDASKTAITSDSQKADSALQKVKVGEKEYAASIDNIAKEYTPAQLLDEDNKYEDLLDYYAKSTAASFKYTLIYYIPMQYASETEEVQKKYSFYQNDKVFTIEIDKSKETEQIKDGEDKVIREETVTNKETYQVDLTDGNVAYRTFSEYKLVKNYKKTTGGHVEGDVYVDETLEAAETITTRKEVKVKEVALDKYRAIGFEIEE